MSTATHTGATASADARVLTEGYGSGAWHGPDLKAAIADVSSESAFWRPAAGRHNIAEIAVHHAYCVRNARAKISGAPAEPFVLDGDDWFALQDGSQIAWPRIQALVEAEHRQIAKLVGDIEAGRATSSLPATERFDLTLGVTCHAVYHAGQIQLIKAMQRR